MDYLEALALAHRVLQPGRYVEIGCRTGRSLALARCPSIGVDPDYEITAELVAPTRLFAQTSDSFFAREDFWEVLEERPDLSFIDGMHLVEYALRDFIGLERCSKPSSVILIDDVLPARTRGMSRERKGKYWTGDVYRLVPILREYRPDLAVAVYDVDAKGLAVISNLDPTSEVLADRGDEIRRRIVAGDWVAGSKREVRRWLQPVPTSRLADDLRALAERQGAGDDGGVLGDRVDTRRLYLDLLKKSLLNEIYLDDELRIRYLHECVQGSAEYSYERLHDVRRELASDYAVLAAAREQGRFPQGDITTPTFSHTMIGRRRLDALQDALDVVRLDGVPGDLVECGVWRGGACIFMAGYLRAFGMTGRRVVVADSFEGLPLPSHRRDRGVDLSKERYPQLAVDLETVRTNFELYDLLGDEVVFLPGWFADTLPDADIDEIALLRLDGDLYSSTMDCLRALYDKVVAGGIVVVDDYGALRQCRRAVRDFFKGRGEPVPDVVEIDWTGVYWIKG